MFQLWHSTRNHFSSKIYGSCFCVLHAPLSTRRQKLNLNPPPIFCYTLLLYTLFPSDQQIFGMVRSLGCCVQWKIWSITYQHFPQEGLLSMYKQKHGDSILQVSVLTPVIILLNIFSCSDSWLFTPENAGRRGRCAQWQEDEHHQCHGHPQGQAHEGHQEEAPQCRMLGRVFWISWLLFQPSDDLGWSEYGGSESGLVSIG